MACTILIFDRPITASEYLPRPSRLLHRMLVCAVCLDRCFLYRRRLILQGGAEALHRFDIFTAKSQAGALPVLLSLVLDFYYQSCRSAQRR